MKQNAKSDKPFTLNNHVLEKTNRETDEIYTMLEVLVISDHSSGTSKREGYSS
jgi:hypothetical protein